MQKRVGTLKKRKIIDEKKDKEKVANEGEIIFTLLHQKKIITIYIAQLDLLAGVDTIIGTIANKEKTYKPGPGIPLEANTWTQTYI